MLLKRLCYKFLFTKIEQQLNKLASVINLKFFNTLFYHGFYFDNFLKYLTK